MLLMEKSVYSLLNSMLPPLYQFAFFDVGAGKSSGECAGGSSESNATSRGCAGGSSESGTTKNAVWLSHNFKFQ